MESIQDFEDMLYLLEKHDVRYLIIGGLAFIFHAKPRYTKDMDLWIDPDPQNIIQANKALAEFGSPFLLSLENLKEILQLGVAPDRIDLILSVPGLRFQTAWKDRVCSHYGRASANWAGLNTMIRIKSKIDLPRHQEDAKVLREVKRRKKLKKK